jgi:hypothetical protein
MAQAFPYRFEPQESGRRGVSGFLRLNSRP